MIRPGGHGNPMSLKKTQKIIAHRGGVVDQRRSENSLAALEEAIRRQYSHVEIDARITADGHVVCFHNDNLMEEAGVDARISEMPLKDVTGTRLLRSDKTIPTFDSYCARCSGRIGVMVDLKGCAEAYIDTYTREIVAALEKHELLGTALILTNKTPVNNQDRISERFLGRSRVSWRHGLDQTQLATSNDPHFAQNHYIFNHGVAFSRDDIAGFQALGLEVIVSINTYHYASGEAQREGEAHILKMLQFGVNGLQIDSCYDPILFPTAS